MKHITVLLAAILVLGFAACSQKQTDIGEAPVPAEASPISAPVSATPEPTATPVPTPEPTATPVPTPEPTATPEPTVAPVTFAWVSDTQGYVAAYPEMFTAMTTWIRDNRDAYNIQYLLHTGDIVNEPRNDRQWERATESLGVLKGVMPIFAVGGNHDIAGVCHEYGRYNSCMSAVGAADWPTVEAFEEKGRRCDLIDIGDERYMLIGIGYCVSMNDVEWMRQKLEEHADRKAILLFHWLLDADLTVDSPKNTDGTRIYRNVLQKCDNIALVLCGHKHTVNHTTIDITDPDDRNTVLRSIPVVIGDYQGGERDGGYLFLITFDVEAREIRFTSYSPVKDDFNYLDDETIETFTLRMP